MREACAGKQDLLATLREEISTLAFAAIQLDPEKGSRSDCDRGPTAIARSKVDSEVQNGLETNKGPRTTGE